jgi:hypothetical protein
MAGADPRDPGRGQSRGHARVRRCRSCGRLLRALLASRLVPETTKAAEDGDRSLIVSFAIDPPAMADGIEYLSISSYMAHMRALESAYQLREEEL